MQRPDHGNTGSLQKAEQHLIVHIKAVQRVQVNQIGLEGLDLADHSPGGSPGIQPRVIGKPRQHIVRVILQTSRSSSGVRIRGIRTGAIQNSHIAAAFSEQVRNVRDDFPGASDSVYQIDKQHPHMAKPPFS